MNVVTEKICVLLTGGTICSLPNDNDKNTSNAAKTSIMLTKFFKEESGSPFQGKVDFDIVSLRRDILSENMTMNIWLEIIQIFRTDILTGNYKGVIILHGTDTLAYTSSFLSMVLSGIKIPVCLVSAQLGLGVYLDKAKKKEWVKNEKTNGYANFCASVELIMNGLAPNVYVVYRNEGNEHNRQHDPGAFLVHYGSHLLQCQNESNNFHSRDEIIILDTTNARIDGRCFENSDCFYEKIDKVDNGVVVIKPYTNLDYTDINLDGKKIVIHGTYHSESMCIGRDVYNDKKVNRDDFVLDEIIDEDRNYSILFLLEKCKKRNIPVFLVPCDKENAAYGTTANAIKNGAIPLKGITFEAAYAKAILGISLGIDCEHLKEFMEKTINGEL